jgi:hypothetical protein
MRLGLDLIKSHHKQLFICRGFKYTFKRPRGLRCDKDQTLRGCSITYGSKCSRCNFMYRTLARLEFTQNISLRMLLVCQMEC